MKGNVKWLSPRRMRASEDINSLGHEGRNTMLGASECFTDAVHGKAERLKSILPANHQTEDPKSTYRP
jgi:hypothetical protein